MGRLEGKVAFITGGARGQGRSHALAMAREGADIVVSDVDEQLSSVPYRMATADDLRETVALVEKLGRRAIGMKADVRSQQELDAVRDRALEEFGRIDVVVANAGIWSRAPMWEITDESWDQMIGVNLTGVWHTIKSVAPSMIEAQAGGSIILISSVNGVEAAPDDAHYVAAKHGVLGLMRAAALELAPHGIRSNAVLPGFIDSAMTDWQGSYDMTAGRVGSNRQEHERNAFHWPALAGRGLLQPAAVSDTVVWLASDESQHLTGLAVPVDGGHLILPGYNHNPLRERPANDTRPEYSA